MVVFVVVREHIYVLLERHSIGLFADCLVSSALYTFSKMELDIFNVFVLRNVEISSYSTYYWVNYLYVD